MTLDALGELDQLRLVNHKRTGSLELIDAVQGQPSITLTMDGASSLDVTVSDHKRTLMRSPLVQTRSWAEVAGIRFELVGFSKAGDAFTLKFEDAIAAALRRRKKPLSIPAGSTTRREIVQRLAREARVPFDVDDEKRINVTRAVQRSQGGSGKTSSWDLLGDLASEVHWRRFSNGRRLIVGSDDWLIARDPKPTRVREEAGAVQDIDFDLDTGKRASTARLTVDARLWSLPPGSVVEMGDDMGPCEGRWLVNEFTRPMFSSRAAVGLVRKRHELKEPKRRGHGEPGEPDYVPGLDGGAAGDGAAANPARERMVRFALSKNGNPYEYGGNGPTAYDCSGLVQAAMAYAGHPLPKPSANQAAAVARAGKTLSIETAIRTRGALLFSIGSADFNHVAISLGNGSTIEAMGESYGVCIGRAAGRGWTSAGWWI